MSIFGEKLKGMRNAGCLLTATAGLIVYLVPGEKGLTIAACLGIPGILLVAVVANRLRGLYIENKYISSLKLPKDWKIERNLVLPSGGDLDVLVTDPNKNRFAIEIKSHDGAMLRKKWITGGEYIVRLNGKKFRTDPVKQVELAAEHLGARPVVWFPVSKIKHPLRLKNGTTIVHGEQRYLKREIGAGSTFSFD